VTTAGDAAGVPTFDSDHLGAYRSLTAFRALVVEMSAKDLHIGTPRGKRPRLAPAQRVCEQDGCGTVLSRYNKEQLCGVHQSRG
jgi:hypothetical protein